MDEHTAVLAAAPVTLPDPGWYPDPAGGLGVRWWSGAAWTGHRREVIPVPPSLPAAGWYPDPSVPGLARWWTGIAWTADVVVVQAAPPALAAVPAAPPPAAIPVAAATATATATATVAALPAAASSVAALPAAATASVTVTPPRGIAADPAAVSRRDAFAALASSRPSTGGHDGGPAWPARHDRGIHSHESVRPATLASAPIDHIAAATRREAAHTEPSIRWLATSTENPVGRVALALAIAGVVLVGLAVAVPRLPVAVPAAIVTAGPVLAIAGVVVLAAAAILAVVGLTRRGRRRAASVVALVLSLLVGALGALDVALAPGWVPSSVAGLPSP